MPHIVIDCSQNIIKLKSPQDIMQKVFSAAVNTELFNKADIKVRIKPFEFYYLENNQDDFVHVFTNIMEGRTVSQKKSLSDGIFNELNLMFPDIESISVNIIDFEKATYCKK